VEAAFAMAAPSIGMAEAELTEAALATNAAATTTYIDLRIARSFIFSAVQCAAAHVGSMRRLHGVSGHARGKRLIGEYFWSSF
jgi:hypothetical protein